MTKDLIKAYSLHADSERAVAMKAYMRDQFEFYGIPRPLRNEINKQFFVQFDNLSSADKIKTVKALWKAPQRELQYFAMDAIVRKSKDWPVKFHELFDYMLQNKSWWDTVDTVAVNCCGEFLRRFPELSKQKLSDWTSSGDFWLHRTAILFQLKYKNQTDEKLLFRLCSKYAGESEFFLRKAIGWALRQYSKTNPGAVRKFIRDTNLSPLSVKEGSKYL
jgi:3-methyladenine DNA glycosylase AlkD